MSGKGSKNASINLTASSPLSEGPRISSIEVLAGQYISQNSSSTNNSTYVQVQQIIFPFRARFVFSNGEMAEISFNEKANYDVSIAFL